MRDIKSEPPREGRLPSSVAAEESTSGGRSISQLQDQFKSADWFDYVAQDIEAFYRRFRSLIEAELRREAALASD